jgi:hypothetical protein
MAFTERKSYLNLLMAFLVAFVGGISGIHFFIEFVNGIFDGIC